MVHFNFAKSGSCQKTAQKNVDILSYILDMLASKGFIQIPIKCPTDLLARVNLCVSLWNFQES